MLRQVGTVSTIKRTAAGFPEDLEASDPPKCSYVSKEVDDKAYFLYRANNRKVVCFLMNALPEIMNRQVARLQPDGVLRYQTVPPLFNTGI